MSKIRNSFIDDGDVFEYDQSDSSSFSHFKELKLDKAAALIRDSSSKISMLDPIPTSLLKQCVPQLTPILAKIINPP